jgi:hypothetical protein
MGVGVTIALNGISNPWIRAVAKMIIPAEVTAMFEPFVMLFAFAIHMMIDLLALFLEVAGLTILALFKGTNCLAIEMPFNAITPGVQVLFDTLTLRCVAVSIAALGASVGQAAGELPMWSE